MQKIVAGGFALACSVLLAQGCGRKSPTAPASVGTGKTVAAINAIQIGGGPDNAPLTVGETRQLSARAHMSDGTTSDITPLVEWSSIAPDVATVTRAGMVTAIGAGAGRIRARYGDTTSESTFTVVKNVTDGSGDHDSSDAAGSGDGSSGSGGGSNNPGGSGSGSGTGTGTTLPGIPVPGVPGVPVPGIPVPPTVQSITVTGDNTVPVGRSAQFHAIAHMSDGTDRDVTGGANWQSDNSIIGSISQGGLLTALFPGSNVVTANYDGQSASKPVTVTPF